MIVDVHTHLWENPQQLGQGVAEQLRQRARAPWELADASTLAFDQAMLKVQRAIILGFASAHLGASVPHNQVARYVGRQPRKYLGFAGIDPLMPRSPLDSLTEALGLGLRGVVISPAAQACHPTHSRMMKLLAECETRGLPVLVHPGVHLAPNAIMEFSRPYLLDEVGREFPNLKLIIAQVGHPWMEETLELLSKHAGFFADLSDVVTRPWQLYQLLLQAHQLQVTDHLLFGSDFPFCTPERAIYNVYAVNQQLQGTSLPPVPQVVLRGIVEQPALQRLGLTDANDEAGSAAAPPATAADTLLAEDDDEAGRNEEHQ